MIPVYMYGDRGPRGLMFEDLEHRLLHICNDHQKAKRASAFALVLFDFTSPQIPRALDEPSYWAALDAISGRTLTVFAVHAGVLPDIRSQDTTQRLGLYREFSGRTRQGLAKYFDLEATPFPVLLFFQVDEREIIGSIFVGLKERSTEAAFNEIRELLQLAAGSVTDSAGRAIPDPKRAFQRLEEAMAHRRIKTLAKAGVGVGKDLLDFLGLLFGRS